MRARFVAMAAVVCAAMVPAACSDDESPQAETSVVTVEIVPPSTAKPAPTTTTSTTEPKSSSSSTTSTVPVEIPTWPLTGLPLPEGVDADRPAMVVKIDNHPKARPQSGLNEADIVFEENVEQLTRFAAVFHSNGADPVGPIRSGRTQDIDLLGSLNRPLFVWSGGNRRVTDAIFGSDLRQISPTAGGPFFRTERPGPHDLYSNVSALYVLAPADAMAPMPQFEYRDADTEPPGSDADGVKVSMDNVRVIWQWDPATESYLRLSDDVPHKDTVFDAQLNTQNVLILTVDYRPSPADGRSPEAQTIGSGELAVYTAGTVQTGTWTRADRLSPFVLTDASGAVIELTPGRTFVELARIGKSIVIPAGVDAEDVPYP